jgi:hypothetical protein
VPPSIVIAAVKVFNPVNVKFPVPPPVKASVLMVPEITPFMTSVPPLACMNVCVLPLLAPRIMGASIVFVPEVLFAPIATALLLLVSLPIDEPVAVSVNLIDVLELVMSYPDDAVD